MVKPSIFSRDYKKKMRKRNIRLALSFFVVIFVTGIFIATNRGYFSKNTKNQPTTKVSENTTKVTETTKPETETIKPETEAIKEEGFDFKLSDGKSLKAVYEVTGSEKTFKYIAPKENNVNYSISPSGKNIVVFDSGVQSIILIDINGTVQDITNLNYVSSSGLNVNKDDVLKANSSYIWCQSPRFIDDSTVAYISQLPWLKKTTQYVWTVNINTKEHAYVRAIQGQNVKFNELESKGLKITVDDNVVYLTADGQVSR